MHYENHPYVIETDEQLAKLKASFRAKLHVHRLNAPPNKRVRELPPKDNSGADSAAPANMPELQI